MGYGNEWMPENPRAHNLDRRESPEEVDNYCQAVRRDAAKRLAAERRDGLISDADYRSQMTAVNRGLETRTAPATETRSNLARRVRLAEIRGNL